MDKLLMNFRRSDNSSGTLGGLFLREISVSRVQWKAPVVTKLKDLLLFDKLHRGDQA